MRVAILAALAAALTFSLVTPAFATVYWTPEDWQAAERARAARAAAIAAGEFDAPRAFPGADQSAAGAGTAGGATGTAGKTAQDYFQEFHDAVWFIAGKQVTDSTLVAYGGIREAEHLLSIIQTDNTSESIWMFSRYYELTGDASILPYLDRSWIYVNNRPAYNEEGGSDVFGGYYRMYNCGWALRAALKYVEVFGDTQYDTYVDSCANYIATHNLRLTGPTGLFNEVNPPVLAWAARNLRDYGNTYGDSLWQFRAWKRGERVKGWVEDDILVMDREEWAVSPGMTVWGLLGSYFDEFPAEESLWVATYAAQMDTFAEPDTWENAHQAWYALGMNALEISTGDPAWGTMHANMTSYLDAFDDTDQDGGIYGQPADADTMDHAWITAYMGFMCYNPFISVSTSIAENDRPGDAGAVPGLALLGDNRPNPFNPRTVIPFRVERAGDVVLEIIDPAGRLVERVVSGHLPAGAHEAEWLGRDSRGRAVASSVYFYRLRAGTFEETRKMILVK